MTRLMVMKKTSPAYSEHDELESKFSINRWDLFVVTGITAVDVINAQDDPWVMSEILHPKHGRCWVISTVLSRNAEEVA